MLDANECHIVVCNGAAAFGTIGGIFGIPTKEGMNAPTLLSNGRTASSVLLLW